MKIFSQAERFPHTTDIKLCVQQLLAVGNKHQKCQGHLTSTPTPIIMTHFRLQMSLLKSNTFLPC